ncbi:MAG: hypothetical protein BWY66_02663 [bacterium ADurb.Bin374]|nr:MAG: hypothetical protein BWY66_02663 [bacterium ADurb.Bin374]
MEEELRSEAEPQDRGEGRENDLPAGGDAAKAQKQRHDQKFVEDQKTRFPEHAEEKRRHGRGEDAVLRIQLAARAQGKRILPDGEVRFQAQRDGIGGIAPILRGLERTSSPDRACGFRDADVGQFVHDGPAHLVKRDPVNCQSCQQQEQKFSGFRDSGQPSDAGFRTFGCFHEEPPAFFGSVRPLNEHASACSASPAIIWDSRGKIKRLQRAGSPSQTRASRLRGCRWLCRDDFSLFSMHEGRMRWANRGTCLAVSDGFR